jgi:ATP-dependent RNA helicase DeaD
MARAHAAETLHGDLNQVQRDRVMNRFRSGQCELLIATDVAARGLDVEAISHVINYDLPQDPESYVHRIGRTARAGRSGCAISLVIPRERYLLQSIQRATSSAIQKMRLPTADDVLTRRHDKFKETLREAIVEGELDQYEQLAESLGDEFSVAELAAAAFKLLLGAMPELNDEKLAEPEESYSSSKSSSKRSGNDRKPAPRRATAEGGMTRLNIDVGRRQGVRPSDIVGAIANEADIPGRSIGAIEIFEQFTLVDVPSPDAQTVIQALKQSRIRNQPITITLAKPFKENR